MNTLLRNESTGQRSSAAKVPYVKRDFLLADLPKSIAQIQVETCVKYGITLLELVSRRRKRPLVYYRQEAMARCVEETAASLPVIGRAFNRDHTTVIHAARVCQERAARGA